MLTGGAVFKLQLKTKSSPELPLFKICGAEDDHVSVPPKLILCFSNYLTVEMKW